MIYQESQRVNERAQTKKIRQKTRIDAWETFQVYIHLLLVSYRSAIRSYTLVPLVTTLVKSIHSPRASLACIGNAHPGKILDLAWPIHRT